VNAVSQVLTFAWQRALIVLVLIELVLLAGYFDTARAMVEIWWRSETFNHAFLVPPIALWLIWEKRRQLAGIMPRPVPWIIVPMVVVVFGWLLGELAAVNAVTQLALVALLVLAVPLVIGWPATKRIAFPLGFLFFAVPIGEFVMPKLMDWTAMFTVMGLRASGIPVYQEGLHFVIPSGKWSVVEACSGVRYLIASLVVGTLYANLNYQSLKRRLIFVGFSILVPLVANWLRAYMIVMLGHFSGNTLAVGVDHLIYGWVFFGVVIMIMFAIGMRWREPEVEPQRETAMQENPVAQVRSVSLLSVAILGLGVALAPRGIITALDSGPELPPPMLSPASLAQGGWEVSDGALADWQPAFANPSGTLNAVLIKGERRVGVFVAYYRQQGYDRKLISSQNELVKSNDKSWAQVTRGSQDVVLAGQPVTVRSGTLRSTLASLGAEPDRYQVRHWYWIGGRIVTSDHLGKLWLALDRLTGRGEDSAAVFVFAQEPDATTTLSEYLAEAGAGIRAMLEGPSRQH
jgi:exosortase A